LEPGSTTDAKDRRREEHSLSMGTLEPSAVVGLSVGRVDGGLLGHERFRRLNAALRVLADELAGALREAAVLRVENRELEARLQLIGRA
jgi:hypothetical protein